MGSLRAAVPRVAVAAACLLAGSLPAACAPDPVQPDSGPAPEGWRWESFGDVELAVPPEWGHGTGDVASALWCISDASTSEPLVLRPGVPIEPTCPPPAAGAPDPATQLPTGGAFVSFVPAVEAPGARAGVEGDRTTTVLGAVLVRVQASADVREQILATLRQVSVDANGCPVSDPISAEPTRRPDPAVAVETLRDVTAVVACRYAFGSLADASTAAAADLAVAVPSATPSPRATGTPGPGGAATLLSSVSVRGEAAAAALRAIADSPRGTGPDAEGACLDPVEIGLEAIVLRVLTGEGANVMETQIYLRYGGCRNGFDDGVAERVLTRAAAGPFASGANLIAQYPGVLAGILDDPDAPATSGGPEEEDR